MITPPADAAAPAGAARPARAGAVWAWLITGADLLYPRQPVADAEDQRWAGLWRTAIPPSSAGCGRADPLRQLWFIAAVVFIASVVVPIGKFIAIIWLARVAGQARRRSKTPIRRLHIYEIVEFIGRWSMIDVFVVAILSALVQLGFVASIHPGPAAVSFALSVAFTMLSAQSFDPRLDLARPAAAQPQGRRMTDTTPPDSDNAPLKPAEPARKPARRRAGGHFADLAGADSGAGVTLGVTWNAYSGRGTLISVEFKDATGITPGETTLKFREITVGKVESVRFTDDLQQVLVNPRRQGRGALYRQPMRNSGSCGRRSRRRGSRGWIRC
jgi:paraquat-inducible protein A